MTPVYGLAEASVGLLFPPLGRGPRIDAIDRQTFESERRAVPAKTPRPCVLWPAAGAARARIRIVDDAKLTRCPNGSRAGWSFAALRPPRATGMPRN
jgi:hypothetical protein